MLPVVAPAFVGGRHESEHFSWGGDLTCPARPAELGIASATKKATATKANSYSSQLLKNCDDGKHSGRPELKSAKSLVADKQ